MKFTSVLAAGTAAVLAVGLAACGSGGDGGDGGDGGASGASGDVTMTMLPKNLGNPYFEASTAGAQEEQGSRRVGCLDGVEHRARHEDHARAPAEG